MFKNSNPNPKQTLTQTKRNEPKTRPRVRRFAYTVNRKGTRKRLSGGLGGGAVYELLVGLREEDKTKLLKTNRSRRTGCLSLVSHS